MAFLKIADGQEVTMTVKAVGQEFARHWVGNQYVGCLGADCSLCKAGIRQDKAVNLDCLVGDQALTWTCPSVAFGNMVALVGSSAALVGHEFTVKRVREANRTIYKSVLTGMVAAPEAHGTVTYATPEISRILHALDAVICSERFAEMLEQQLRPAPLPVEEEIPF